MNIASLDKLKKDENELYVGGNSATGGGSGLSVLGNPSNDKMNEIIQQASMPSESVAENSIRVTFYRNGFQIEDGEFRSLDDDVNKKFLADMEKGFVPKELEKSKNAPVHVNLIDKRQEDYIPPAYTAFSGQGQTMA